MYTINTHGLARQQLGELMSNLKLAHRGHPKEIILLPNAGTGPGRHYARIQCRLCNKFVSWATKEQALLYKE